MVVGIVAKVGMHQQLGVFEEPLALLAVWHRRHQATQIKALPGLLMPP